MSAPHLGGHPVSHSGASFADAWMLGNVPVEHTHAGAIAGCIIITSVMVRDAACGSAFITHWRTEQGPTPGLMLRKPGLRRYTLRAHAAEPVGRIGRPLEALASFMANSAGPAIAYETGPIRAVRGIPPGRPRVGNEGPANQCRCRFSKHRRRSIRCPCRLVILNQGATDPLSSPIDEDSCRVEPALRLRRS
jgi:hypothetical protein